MLDEHQVASAVCRYLQECGYSIEQQLTTKQKGVDIVATVNSSADRILVEVKGGTSSHEGSKRSGHAFSSSQIENRVGKALLKGMRLSCGEKKPEEIIALAVPSMPAYQRLLGDIRPMLESLGWPVFWVLEDGSVTLWWPAVAGLCPSPRMVLDRIDISSFDGPCAIQALTASQKTEIPTKPGNYIVVRRAKGDPKFKAHSEAGRFKGKDPTVSVSELVSQWVSGAQVLYVGQTGNLSKRIRQLCDFAAGKPVGHWGGRILWQVHGSEAFELWWQVDLAKDPESTKRRLLRSFVDAHGRLPFANLRE
jgi:hypothetical protein